MISTNEFKAGVVIRYNGDLYQVQSYQHVKMQQRAPIVKTRLLKLKNGNVIEQSFRSGDKFDDVFLERKEIQYLYHDGDTFHFMDTSDYHDIAVGRALIGDRANYMKDNDLVTGVYCDNELLAIELAPSVILKIAETEPGIRGDTSKGGTKPATLETGATIRVPLFCTIGDSVRVNTTTGEYLERA